MDVSNPFVYTVCQLCGAIAYEWGHVCGMTLVASELSRSEYDRKQIERAVDEAWERQGWIDAGLWRQSN